MAFYRIISYPELSRLVQSQFVPRNVEQWCEHRPGTIMCVFEDVDFKATLHRFAATLASLRGLRPGDKLYVLHFLDLRPDRIELDTTATGWRSSRLYFDPVGVGAVKVVASMTLAGDGPDSIRPGPVDEFVPAQDPADLCN